MGINCKSQFSDEGFNPPTTFSGITSRKGLHYTMSVAVKGLHPPAITARITSQNKNPSMRLLIYHYRNYLMNACKIRNGFPFIIAIHLAEADIGDVPNRANEVGVDAELSQESGLWDFPPTEQVTVDERSKRKVN